MKQLFTLLALLSIVAATAQGTRTLEVQKVNELQSAELSTRLMVWDSTNQGAVKYLKIGDIPGLGDGYINSVFFENDFLTFGRQGNNAFTGSVNLGDLRTNSTSELVNDGPDGVDPFLTSADLSGYAELAANNYFTGSNIFENNSFRIINSASGSLVGLTLFRAPNYTDPYVRLSTQSSGAKGEITTSAPGGLNLYATNGEPIAIKNAITDYDETETNLFAIDKSFMPKWWIEDYVTSNGGDNLGNHQLSQDLELNGFGISEGNYKIDLFTGTGLTLGDKVNQTTFTLTPTGLIQGNADRYVMFADRSYYITIDKDNNSTIEEFKINRHNSALSTDILMNINEQFEAKLPNTTLANVYSDDKHIVTYEALQDYVSNNSGGSTQLDNLTDVVILDRQDNEVLVYEEGADRFVNRILNSDIVSYDNTTSGLASNFVKTAIDELNTKIPSTQLSYVQVTDSIYTATEADLLASKTHFINAFRADATTPVDTVLVKLPTITHDGSQLVPSFFSQNGSVIKVIPDDPAVSQKQYTVKPDHRGYLTLTSLIENVWFDSSPDWIVSDYIAVNVTGVTIAQSLTTIEIGATEQMNLSFTPANASDQSGVWASTNETVATVNSSGVITGIAAGTANITFTSNDGGFSDLVEVTVPAPIVGLAPNNTASSDFGTEDNAITGWTSSTSSIDIISQSTDVNVGTYAIEGTANQATVFARIGFNFDVVNGETYTITWDGKESAGADARLYLFNNVTGAITSMTDTWASYSIVLTATATGTATVQWVLVSSTIGQKIFLDNVNITQNL